MINLNSKLLTKPTNLQFVGDSLNDLKLEYKGGISALSKYSLLNDNDYPTYCVTKKDVGDLKLDNLKQTTKEEFIKCYVLKLGYFIDYNNQGFADPISVALSIDKKDERTQIAINNMLEEYVWSVV